MADTFTREFTFAAVLKLEVYRRLVHGKLRSAFSRFPGSKLAVFNYYLKLFSCVTVPFLYRRRLPRPLTTAVAMVRVHVYARFFIQPTHIVFKGISTSIVVLVCIIGGLRSCTVEFSCRDLTSSIS